MLEVKTSLGGLEQFVSRLRTFDKMELEQIVANTITNAIQTQTAMHLDVDGNAFKPYSENYKKYGRIKKGLSTEPDLRVTGDMLNALVADKKGAITTVTVEASQMAKAQGNQRWRKFIGISPKTKEDIKNFVREYVGKVVKS